MTVSRDYYEVLGVPRDADAKTIKNAFRQLARRYHPDISTEPDAEQRFKEIAEAYGVLSDPAKRASYDAQGSAGLAGATAEDLWGGIDFADIFGSGAAAFGSLFERLFGPAAAGPQRSAPSARASRPERWRIYPGPTIFEGSIQRSKSEGLTYPSSTATSLSVLPSSCAFFAIWAALS